MYIRVTLTAACFLAVCSGLACTFEEAPIREQSADESSLELTWSRSGFYAPPPRKEGVQQVVSLVQQKRVLDAARVAAMITTPHAVWLVGGTPKEVKKQVKDTMQAAARERKTPIFVLYNLPFRDCAGYSAGGAVDTAAYNAWIDAVAQGIGKSSALLMLEPDGVGIIPNNTTIYGAQEWCKISLKDENGDVVVDSGGNPVPLPGANPAERYAQLNYALDTLKEAAPGAQVYLDGTHSSWLGVGEAAYRLVQAGVGKSRGFFLNPSNYEATEHNTAFGTWVSMCVAAATVGAEWAVGHFDWCPSQYNAELDFQVDYSPEYAATVTAALQNMLGGASATVPFVIDTSRNGRGAWLPSATYPDAQTWCNAPGRGVGLRPTANTGVPLLDAYLWLKVPGESDGSCTRGIAGGTTDPEWGIADPAAGSWFPEQALELARQAEPKLL